jgi:hypothetical protein
MTPYKRPEGENLYKWKDVENLARRFAEECTCPRSAIMYCGPCERCVLASAIVEIEKLRNYNGL